MDYYSGRVDIVPSARKHGVTDDDMRHALKHSWAVHSTDDSAVTIHIGPSKSAQPLEVAIAHSAGKATIIHAMPARGKFLQ